MRKTPLLLVVFIIFIVITCGCTVPSVPASKPAAPAATSPQPVVQSSAPVSNGLVRNVVIIQRAFDPESITISAGTTVVWTNKDTVSHRVVHLPELPSDKELFYSEPLDKGDTFSYTFQNAGRYYYSDPQYAGGRKSWVTVE